MKIPGVHARGVKSLLATDPTSFVWELHGCVKDVFPIGKIPEEIQAKFSLLNKNAATLAKQFQEMLTYLTLFKGEENELVDTKRVRGERSGGEDIRPGAEFDQDLRRMVEKGERRQGKHDVD